MNGNDDWIYHLDLVKRILCDDCGIEPHKYAENEARVVDNLIKVSLFKLCFELDNGR